ncbi:MAG: hypothetical protein HPY81_11255 [Firmicutes bacterium]|nr:hypothetical protein [Bacillota bacterium]
MLPKIYARVAIPAQTLGKLLNLFLAVDLVNGDAVAWDVLGRTTNTSSRRSLRLRDTGVVSFTPRMRRVAAGRDARALPGAGLRPGLRFRRDVRAKPQVH